MHTNHRQSMVILVVRRLVGLAEVSCDLCLKEALKSMERARLCVFTFNNLHCIYSLHYIFAFSVRPYFCAPVQLLVAGRDGKPDKCMIDNHTMHHVETQNFFPATTSTSPLPQSHYCLLTHHLLTDPLTLTSTVVLSTLLIC